MPRHFPTVHPRAGEAGHTGEVVDLYAIHFDPVFRTEDFASYVHPSMLLEILEEMRLKQHMVDSAGGPIQRFAASLWVRNKDTVQVAKFIHATDDATRKSYLERAYQLGRDFASS